MALKQLLALALLALLACVCTAQPNGRVGRVVTAMNGLQVVGSTGNVNSTGTIGLALFKYGNIFNVRYSVHVTQRGSAAFPANATVNAGNYGANGAVQLTFPTTWQNVTVTPQPERRKNKIYSYVVAGLWQNAASIMTPSGKSLDVLMKDLIKSPRSYYGLVTSPSYPKGAIRGQLYRG